MAGTTLADGGHRWKIKIKTRKNKKPQLERKKIKITEESGQRALKKKHGKGSNLSPL